MCPSPWRALLLTALALLAPAVASAAAERQPWTQMNVSGSAPGRSVPVLRREAPAGAHGPRVVVLPGSGCAGMGPVAPAYFDGLDSAQIWILHKPLSKPWLALDPERCGEAFARDDRPSRWQADALSALQALREREPERPTWVVGISEGGDLLPALGHALGASLRGLVLLSASGLDPAETLRLQALRLGRQDAWQAIGDAARSERPDDELLHGRSLGHWRDLLAWRLFEPLTAQPWTVWLWWGGRDGLIPAEAYERFAREALGRPVRLCSWRWHDADHGLYRPGAGPVQPLVWQALLEATVAGPGAGRCGHGR